MDSSAVMNAIIAKLGSDSALLALMPNGVYEDLAPEGMTRFVIISQIIENDVDVFRRRAYEDHFFLIEARATTKSGGNVKAAAAAIDAILNPQGGSPDHAHLEVMGYGLMGIKREEFVRGTERDERDASIIWKRRGGRYRVYMALV